MIDNASFTSGNVCVTDSDEYITEILERLAHTPTFIPHFIRGLFEAYFYKSIEPALDNEKISFGIVSNRVFDFIALHLRMASPPSSSGKVTWTDIKHEAIKNEKKFVFRGSNITDFLGWIYAGADNSMSLDSVRIFSAVNLSKISYINNNRQDIPVFRWCKRDPNAIAPCKIRPSDVGYDIAIIRKVKTLRQGGWRDIIVEDSITDVETGVKHKRDVVQKVWVPETILYDTGISAQPPPGWFFQMVPRSSQSKTDYRLANSVGTFDPPYTGNVYIALDKIDPTAAELEFPFTGYQLTLLPVVHMQAVEVSPDELTQTERGGKGFGSSNVVYNSSTSDQVALPASSAFAKLEKC